MINELLFFFCFFFPKRHALPPPPTVLPDLDHCSDGRIWLIVVGGLSRGEMVTGDTV